MKKKQVKWKKVKFVEWENIDEKTQKQFRKWFKNNYQDKCPSQNFEDKDMDYWWFYFGNIWKKVEWV